MPLGTVRSLCQCRCTYTHSQNILTHILIAQDSNLDLFLKWTQKECEPIDPGYKAENQFVTEEAVISQRCLGQPAGPESGAPTSTAEEHTSHCIGSLLRRQDWRSSALFPDCSCQQVPPSISRFPVVAPSQMLNSKCTEKINILRFCGLSHQSLMAANALQLALPTGLLSMQLRCKMTSLKSSPPGLFASPFKALVD